MSQRARDAVKAAAPKRMQMADMRARIDRLDEEVQELRRMNRRLAELADLVQEVMVPAANRDDERVRKLLEEYRRGSFEA